MGMGNILPDSGRPAFGVLHQQFVQKSETAPRHAGDEHRPLYMGEASRASNCPLHACASCNRVSSSSRK